MKMNKPSRKHFKLKIYLRHIMRRQWNNTTQNVLTKWLSLKKKKRKWLRYFESTNGKLGPMIWLLGFVSTREAGNAAVRGGLVRVNTVLCPNVNYIVKPYDVITFDRQAFDFFAAHKLSARLKSLFATSADAPTVERRRVIDIAHDELR